MRPDELIDALGGSRAVAEFLGVEPNIVGNWRKRGFAAWAVPALTKMCRARKVDPGDALTPQPRRQRACGPDIERRAQPERAA